MNPAVVRLTLLVIFGFSLRSAIARKDLSEVTVHAVCLSLLVAFSEVMNIIHGAT